MNLSKKNFLNSRMVILFSLVILFSSCLKTENESSSNSNLDIASTLIIEKKGSNAINAINYSNIDAKALVRQHPNLSSVSIYSPGIFTYIYGKSDIDSGVNILSRNDPGKPVYMEITLNDSTVIKKRLK
jgi:hypothetical protein